MQPPRLAILALCLLVLLPAVRAHAFCDLDGLAPGTEVAELVTTRGSICIELLRDDAPLHVDNFLFYLNSGKISGTFIHRAVPGFIVQGGGFTLDGPDAGGDFDAVPGTNGPVTNEPCTRDIPDPNTPGGQICSVRGNVRGTVALAKLGGNPSSGTTNWFINLADNRSNLDNQNGGFTVFGRVIDGTMSTVDAIAALPLATQDQLAWLATSLQASPMPLTSQPPLTSYGCWNPTLQTTILDSALLPALFIENDPVVPGLAYTGSASCGTATTYPGPFDPNSVEPGCAVPAPDLLSVRTTGPVSLSLPNFPTIEYYEFNCLQIEAMLAQRALWLADYKAALTSRLVFVAVTHLQVTGIPALPWPARLLLVLGLLALGASRLGRRIPLR